jgi:hypothetical protein
VKNKGTEPASAFRFRGQVNNLQEVLCPGEITNCAITLARTLLETVCKHILDTHNVTYENDTDLPGLYKLVAKTLNLAPSQHSETIFKQILGGCTAVVEGLGALRNRLSDAHGQGKKIVRPAPRHAELAVNLAGTVAMFLVTTALLSGKSGTTTLSSV